MRPAYRAAVVCTGFVLDRAIGDPVRPTHPARLLGRAIAGYERAVRPRVSSAAGERAAGVVLAVGLPLTTFAAVRTLTRRLPRPAAFALEAWLVGTALAGRDLGDAARRVTAALDMGLSEGRAEVAMIVGRETADLSPDEVVRATVETVAENTSDGVIAPLWYAWLGGAPLALAYKAVSTLDSMVGYRNERYRDFGWASARLDDLLNWLPARLTALLAVAAGDGGREALAGSWRDRVQHASPNAGLVEASFAHSLGIRLGGPARYGSVIVEREPVGDGGRPPEPIDVDRAVRLSDEIARLALGLGAGAALAAARGGTALAAGSGEARA